MNLLIRFLIVLLKSLFAAKQSFTEPSQLTFRVMPWDCDLNMHMTNSRYLSIMDLGRVYFLANQNLIRKLIKRKWSPVLQGVELTFIKPLKPGQKFVVKTQLLSCDEKYFYLSQHFETNNNLCCSAIVKGLFVSGRHKVSVKEVLQLTDTPLEIMTLVKPPIVEYWNQLADAKKQQK